jgi:hypothetical protein
LNLEELRARLGTPELPKVVAACPGSGAPLESILPGYELDGPSGRCFVVDSVRHASERHGRHAFGILGELGTVSLPGPGIQPELFPVDLRTAAFIDTETTGLGYGVGTQVFVIGVGHVDEDSFRIRQFFLRHPGEEEAMLSALARHLEPFSTVVSYNGRSFDWPLLENRFVLRRIRLSRPDPHHLDLLHLSRRLWKLRVDSCSLTSIEKTILGAGRAQDDVEGWMIPQIYFQYLRTGAAGPLRRVLYHNLQDILTLALLTAHVELVLRDPWSGLVEHPIDFLSLGRVCASVGEIDTAVSCLKRALAGDLPARLEAEAFLRLALIEKRRQNWPAALPLFERVVDRPGFQRIACVEMAKYHEHVARDHQQAMSLTVRALRGMDYQPATSWPGTTHMELLHRRRRLMRRLGMSTGRPDWTHAHAS